MAFARRTLGARDCSLARSDAARSASHTCAASSSLADIIAGSITGAIAALVARGSGVQVLRAGRVAVALAWPVLAFVCGLYAGDDLRTWASGVGDAPRLGSTCLAALVAALRRC